MAAASKNQMFVTVTINRDNRACDNFKLCVEIIDEQDNCIKVRVLLNKSKLGEYSEFSRYKEYEVWSLFCREVFYSAIKRRAHTHQYANFSYEYGNLAETIDYSRFYQSLRKLIDSTSI